MFNVEVFMIYFFYSVRVFSRDNLATPILLKSDIYPVKFSFAEACKVDEVFNEVQSQFADWLELTMSIDADNYIIYFDQFYKVG